MLFNSTIFLIFFVIVLIFRSFYSKIPWNRSKTILLFLSYLFYAWWYPPFVIFLFLSSYLDFHFGHQIIEDPEHKRRYLILSCITNLGILGFFKYANFMINNLNWLFGLIGIHFEIVNPSIILPVGISFYTFQSMSYTIDIYRGQLQPIKSRLDFLLYVSFFPQLVAGPIVRASHFLPQTKTYQKWNRNIVAIAVPMIIYGFFKKVVLADQLAEFVDNFFRLTDYSNIHSIHAWIAMYAYAFQIFCDFSGYSDIAIGIALLLGFQFPTNFNKPYFACGFSDFWSRWHISLSTWLKDYLYIPLGGSRKGKLRTYLNNMTTMLLGGLWHGASWNFVIWGGLHGLYLNIERLIRGDKKRKEQPKNFILRLMGVILTFHLVVIAWVFFRSKNFLQSIQIIKALFANFTLTFEPAMVTRLSVVILFFVMLYYLIVYLKDYKFSNWQQPLWLKAFFLAGALELIILFWGRSDAFIYFQF